MVVGASKGPYEASFKPGDEKVGEEKLSDGKHAIGTTVCMMLGAAAKASPAAIATFGLTLPGGLTGFFEPIAGAFKGGKKGIEKAGELAKKAEGKFNGKASKALAKGATAVGAGLVAIPTFAAKQAVTGTVDFTRKMLGHKGDGSLADKAKTAAAVGVFAAGAALGVQAAGSALTVAPLAFLKAGAFSGSVGGVYSAAKGGLQGIKDGAKLSYQFADKLLTPKA